ncbi:hypothetical protein ABH935_000790 [Catenulispora sp. GAS73]
MGRGRTGVRCEALTGAGPCGEGPDRAVGGSGVGLPVECARACQCGIGRAARVGAHATTRSEQNAAREALNTLLVPQIQPHHRASDAATQRCERAASRNPAPMPAQHSELSSEQSGAAVRPCCEIPSSTPASGPYRDPAAASSPTPRSRPAAKPRRTSRPRAPRRDPAAATRAVPIYMNVFAVGAQKAPPRAIRPGAAPCADCAWRLRSPRRSRRRQPASPSRRRRRRAPSPGGRPRRRRCRAP